jgi:threonine dehydratase
VRSVSRPGIERIDALIAPYIRRTPVVEIDGADLGIAAGKLQLKLELLQHAGSFKTRGAFANLLTRNVPAVGVAAASGGNHGAAVAYAARKLGIRARIFVPTISSPAKIARIRDYGAELFVTGDRYADALAACENYIADTGAMSVHAYDQIETMLGQGTLAREFENAAPQLDTLLVSVGGGGLIAGIAAWYDNRIKVVGVEPKSAPTLTNALAAGQPTDAPAGGIAADSLAPKRVGELVFPIARDFVSQVVLVEDDDIAAAQRTLWQVLRIAAEAGGVAALSALLSGRYRPQRGERIGVVISGGNTDAVNFSR